MTRSGKGRSQCIHLKAQSAFFLTHGRVSIALNRCSFWAASCKHRIFWEVILQQTSASTEYFSSHVHRIKIVYLDINHRYFTPGFRPKSPTIYIHHARCKRVNIKYLDVHVNQQAVHFGVNILDRHLEPVEASRLSHLDLHWEVLHLTSNWAISDN